MFLDDYLTERGISGSAALLVGMIGFTSVLGRLGFGAFASRVSPLRLYQASYLVISAQLPGVAGRRLPLPGAGGSSPSCSAWPTAGSSRCGPGRRRRRLRPDRSAWAACWAPSTPGPGWGGLLGPPAAGALIDRFGYSTAILAALAFGVASFAFLLPIRTDDGG